MAQYFAYSWILCSTSIIFSDAKLSWRCMLTACRSIHFIVDFRESAITAQSFAHDVIQRVVKHLTKFFACEIRVCIQHLEPADRYNHHRRRFCIHLHKWPADIVKSSGSVNPLMGTGNYSAHRIIWSWYTGHWWVGCYIRYSEEGTGRGRTSHRIFV